MALQNYSEQHVFHMMSRITMLILKKNLQNQEVWNTPGKFKKNNKNQKINLIWAGVRDNLFSFFYILSFIY